MTKTERKIIDRKLKEIINQMVKDNQPINLFGTLYLYGSGYYLKEHLSKNTYYKHRKILQKYGVDIKDENLNCLFS